MTVLQRVRSTLQIERTDVVASGAIDVGGQFSETDDLVGVGECCAEKLNSFR